VNAATLPASAALCGTILLLSLARPAIAEELRYEASAGLQSEFNDNPNLVGSSEASSVYGLIADVGLQASIGGPAWKFSVAPRVVARRYTGENDLDSHDLSLQTGYERSLERGDFAITASYAQQYTLTSQFAATGTVDQNVPRNALAIALSGTRPVTERWALNGSLSAEDVRYPDGEDVGLYDYRYWLASGAAGYALNERTSVKVISRFARLDADGTGLRSREYTAGLGLDHAWNEHWRVSLNAGPSLATTNGQDRGTSLSYQASLSGAWERSSFSLSAQHILSPNSSQGRLQVSDSVAASYRYRLREELAASAFVRTERYSDRAGATTTTLQDSYGTSAAGVALDGVLGPSLSWRASYAHVVREGSGSPRSNAVTLGVSWRGLSRSSSL
jgi:hypothetical protein